MFPPTIIRKKIFGIDIKLELDIIEPIFRAWQFIYFWQLRYFWKNKITFDAKSSLLFMKYALTNLPIGSFVIFIFDEEDEVFVQFRKGVSYIYLLIPFWDTNKYMGKRAELSKLLKKTKIKKSAIRRQNYDRNKNDVTICFHKNYSKAAKFATFIAKEMFNYADPILFDYDTERLVSK